MNSVSLVRSHRIIFTQTVAIHGIVHYKKWYNNNHQLFIYLICFELLIYIYISLLTSWLSDMYQMKENYLDLYPTKYFKLKVQQYYLTTGILQ